MKANLNPINKILNSIKSDNEFWVKWLYIFIFWSIIALLDTLQIYARFLPEEYEIVAEGQKISWIQWMLREFPGWYIFAFFTPIIFRFGQKFSFEVKEKRLRIILIHTLLSIIFAFIYIILETFFARIISGVSLDPSLFFNSVSGRITRSTHIIIAGYWAILGLGVAIDFYQKYREREAQAIGLALQSSLLKTQLIQSKFDLLKMQLHPHFLFNTLHAISALVEKKPKIARDMIADLSELLRFTLEATEQQTIPLRKELEITQLYLGIEQQRFRDKLKVVFQVNDNDLEVEIPSFILQPLIENSIKHGITNENNLISIEIKIVRTGKKLEINVKDNGKGFPEESLDRMQMGIGLNNIKARLNQLYGDNQEFVIQNAQNGGAIVRITLPVN